VSLKAGQAYWIKVNLNQTLVVSGEAYPLFAGWNLIGWRNQAKVILLKVNRFAGIGLTDDEVDDILLQGTSLLQKNDGAGDVPTFVALVRDGPVTTFTTSPPGGVINSQADYNTVIAMAGQAKVINLINWCGAFIPGVIGCANVPGSSIAVVRYGITAHEGVLWVHELGHNRGLNHRTDLDVVMHPTVNLSNRKVNPAESGAY
jgi:hypothetical protein